MKAEKAQASLEVLIVLSVLLAILATTLATANTLTSAVKATLCEKQERVIQKQVNVLEKRVSQLAQGTQITTTLQPTCNVKVKTQENEFSLEKGVKCELTVKRELEAIVKIQCQDTHKTTRLTPLE